MRKSSTKEGLKTTGEGLEWGVLLGFGPGITIDIPSPELKSQLKLLSKIVMLLSLGHLREVGLTFYLLKDMPEFI
ncbi:hypothetical protein RJ639_016029 [Escallonia herrerae]|uniref:Chalcone/stilbene synthase C-terminal domain-containing protein n=1 Tax=Escallonia herrerae TaxID=1293975 RepID=A0AA88VCF1_9ASTE|nr:hypothetical protein RJ639_016029 [Escallonia herrerae]